MEKVDYRRQAEALARAGNFREAVRLTYLHLLARLGERGLTPKGPSFTDAECLEAVRPFGLEPSMLFLVDRFRRIRYAGADCKEAEYTAFRREASTILENSK